MHHTPCSQVNGPTPGIFTKNIKTSQAVVERYNFNGSLPALVPPPSDRSVSLGAAADGSAAWMSDVPLMLGASCLGLTMPTAPRSPYTVQCLQPGFLHVIIEDDLEQFPFCYVLTGVTCLILIDTGSGTGNIFEELEAIAPPESRQKILIVCTHTHFDHCGCNHLAHSLGKDKAEWCVDICVSNRAQEFSLQARMPTAANLSLAPPNRPIKPYSISRWLDHESEITDLGPNRPPLRVFHTPGHTPDSICIYDPLFKHCFVGDTLYRWSPISLTSPGSNFEEFCTSIELLLKIMPSDAILHCGHVDAQLEDAHVSLSSLHSLCMAVKTGTAKECDVQSGNGELALREFALPEEEDRGFRIVLHGAPTSGSAKHSAADPQLELRAVSS
eukprot:1930252-Rhodomonas_salina.5